MPELITETLLVVEPFKDRGTDFLRGDRVPLHHRRIRQLAAKEPGWFRMEYAPEEVDLGWLAGLEAEYEDRYHVVKREREEAKVRQERALREEIASQDRPQTELERRFKRQEDAERKRKEEIREEREREKVEQQAAIIGDGPLSGFHY
jgi:hypothetical protein